MKIMEIEIKGQIRGFNADVMAEILAHRTSSPGAGLVASFANNVRRHAAEAATALQNMRARADAGPHVAAIESAEKKISDMAQAAIGRAEAAGEVEFQEAV